MQIFLIISHISPNVTLQSQNQGILMVNMKTVLIDIENILQKHDTSILFLGGQLISLGKCS